MNHIKVLIADDNPNVCEIIKLYFEKNEIEVVLADNGRSAVELAKTENPDMVILDIMMPEMDGLEACRNIRKHMNVPIIMLTAKDEEFDRVLGLEIGADDYVTKPFSPRELVARIKAILRRSVPEQEISVPEKRNNFDLGALFIDIQRREVTAGKEKIFFRPKEFDLLTHFAENPGNVLTRDQLLEHVWGYDYFGDIRTVDVHVKKVREKLKEHDISCIHTIWGVGYRFEMPNIPEKEMI